MASSKKVILRRYFFSILMSQRRGNLVMKMKFFLFLFAVFLVNQSAFAANPECDSVQYQAPCVYNSVEAKSMLFDMIVGNSKGYHLMRTYANSPLILGEAEENVRVTLLKEHEPISNGNFQNIQLYEVILIDCRLGDQCGESYLWTTTETTITTSNENDFTTTYANSIVKARKLP
jgi:hypothetical protein